MGNCFPSSSDINTWKDNGMGGYTLCHAEEKDSNIDEYHKFDLKRDILISNPLGETIEMVDWKRKASIEYKNNKLNIVCYANIKIEPVSVFGAWAELYIPNKLAILDEDLPVHCVNLKVHGSITIAKAPNSAAMLRVESNRLNIDCAKTLYIGEAASVSTTTESPPTLTIRAENFEIAGQISALIKEPEEPEPDSVVKDTGAIEVKCKEWMYQRNARWLVQEPADVARPHSPEKRGKQDEEWFLLPIKQEGEWKCIQIQENDQFKEM